MYKLQKKCLALLMTDGVSFAPRGFSTGLKTFEDFEIMQVNASNKPISSAAK